VVKSGRQPQSDIILTSHSAGQKPNIVDVRDACM